MTDSSSQSCVPRDGHEPLFLSATKAIPKEMLPVVDKSLIQYAVEEAYAVAFGK